MWWAMQMSRGQGIQLSYLPIVGHMPTIGAVPVNSCCLPSSLWRLVVPHIYFQKRDRDID